MTFVTCWLKILVFTIPSHVQIPSPEVRHRNVLFYPKSALQIIYAPCIPFRQLMGSGCLHSVQCWPVHTIAPLHIQVACAVFPERHWESPLRNHGWHWLPGFGTVFGVEHFLPVPSNAGYILIHTLVPKQQSFTD